ncbi:NAD/NADP-dependent octopine/nopaline dehydrogenase family protein [Thermosediminibacter litoriperuensis]|uniref:Opine dehydrogenase n=1 Tax=Thermosediminibacter litoriperuensis TaxID=291989 RepID=A0A5S5ANL6_9FIRM|nr:NAD/NADP-dependent octopine/nopaline dehydrogenase family protein [Thermosediminibacter litoriperuensis]TYP52435.1 opine dehydrogenase [Thermosediminibacter litoriperuensis]
MIKGPEEVRYTVIGAGNGGLAMAGYLGLMGFTVNLYNRSEEKIKDLIKDPKIHLTGAVEGEGKLSMVTTDIRETIEGSDIIMVTTPATAHRELAEQMAPYIKDNQIIVLNPGRTCGALEVYETLRKSGCTKNVIVAEAQTFIYACRATGPTSARIFSVKNEVKLAAIPAEKTELVIRLLSAAYPQFKPARDVMETSLNNFGAIFHPAPTLLNSGHIERGQTFEYYLEGITPSIGQMLERLDAERMKVARVLGVKAISAMQWLEDSYGACGNSIYEAIQNNPAYKGLTAPKDLKTRYIYEDVPFSLVPISSLAKNLGIETPAIDTIIRLANMMTGVNFWEQGRTVDKLGLAGLSPAEIHEFVQNGYLEIKRPEEEVVA